MSISFRRSLKEMWKLKFSGYSNITPPSYCKLNSKPRALLPSFACAMVSSPLECYLSPFPLFLGVEDAHSSDGTSSTNFPGKFFLIPQWRTGSSVTCLASFFLICIFFFLLASFVSSQCFVKLIDLQEHQ